MRPRMLCGELSFAWFGTTAGTTDSKLPSPQLTAGSVYQRFRPVLTKSFTRLPLVELTITVTVMVPDFLALSRR